MNDQDYICKAVELADRWDLTHIYDGEDIVSLSGTNRVFNIDFVLQQPTQAGLDALAAQLVRQVDATECTVTVTDQYSEIATWQDDAYGCHETVHGHGRTMNTIKIVVDSKVLE